MKKIIALVLSLVLVMSVSVAVFAADVGGGNGSDIIDWEDIINASVIRGDLTGDKKVSAIDARQALKKAAGTEATTSNDLKVADFNNDGKITAYDARQILKLAAQ